MKKVAVLARLFFDTLEKAKEDEQQKIIDAYASLYRRKGWKKFGAEFMRGIEKEGTRREAIATVTIESAHELDDAIKRLLTKQFPDKNLVYTIDPSLVAGFTVKTHDLHIRATLHELLHNLI